MRGLITSLATKENKCNKKEAKKYENEFLQVCFNGYGVSRGIPFI